MSFCSYYRKLFKRFSLIAKLLHLLIERKLKLIWINECKTAFDKLKEYPVSLDMLVLSTLIDEFILDTDASQDGIGAVLSRNQKKRKSHSSL